ncbi:MAG: hypothetical protein HY678_08670 [Chloroflexi bacterium]|nr:hypothetical protein [Chloroflexota bacterium]
MTQTKARRKVVKTLPRGQVTIPGEFREALGIEAETLLSVSLVGDHLEIAPLRLSADLRRYTEEEIDRFLEEDKLDKKVRRSVRALLRRRAI